MALHLPVSWDGAVPPRACLPTPPGDLPQRATLSTYGMARLGGTGLGQFPAKGRPSFLGPAKEGLPRAGVGASLGGWAGVSASAPPGLRDTPWTGRPHGLSLHLPPAPGGQEQSFRVLPVPPWAWTREEGSQQSESCSHHLESWMQNAHKLSYLASPLSGS